MVRKPFCVLLIAVLLFSGVLCAAPSRASADNGEIVLVPCVSNLSDQRQIEVYIDARQAHLREEDAARVSGFIYQGGSTTTAYYERAGESIAVPLSATNAQGRWVSLYDALYQLHTSVVATDFGLVFVGMESTPYELFALADPYMRQGGKYNLLDGEDFYIQFGFALSNLYNRIIKMQFLGYSEECYKGILRELLEVEENSPLVQILLDSGELSKHYEELRDLGLEDNDIFKTLDILGDLSDPVKTLSDRLLEIEGFSISGLDFFDQVALYADIDSLMRLSTFGENLIRYTYSSDTISAQKMRSAYVPSAAWGAINDVLTYTREMDASEMMAQVLLDEAENMLKGTAGSLVNNLITKGMGPKIAAFILGEVNESLFPETIREMDYVETFGYLAELQSPLPALYEEYRRSPQTAIHAKYTALLYLRIVQMAFEKYEQYGLTEEGRYDFDETIEAAMASLIEIDDSDLLFNPAANNPISPETILSIGVTTPENIQLGGGFEVGDIMMRAIDNLGCTITSERDLLKLCCELTWESNDFEAIEHILAHCDQAQCTLLEYERLGENEEYYLFDIVVDDGLTRYTYRLRYQVYIGLVEGEMYQSQILSSTEESLVPMDGLALWWYGGDPDGYFSEMEQIYGLAENDGGTMYGDASTGIPIGNALATFVSQWSGQTGNFSPFCDLIDAAYFCYDWNNASIELLESDVYGWGPTPYGAGIYEEYYRFRVTSADMDWEDICVRMYSDASGNAFEGRLYDSSASQTNPDDGIYDDGWELLPEYAPDHTSGNSYCGMYVVNCEEWISLRESPDTDSARLAKIPLGTYLEVYSFDSQWGYCDYGDAAGFVLLEYLSYDPPYVAGEPENSASYDDSAGSLGDDYAIYLDSYTGRTLVPEDPSGLTAWASSELVDQYGSYCAANVVDGSADTTWAEGALDMGIGETISIYLPAPKEIGGIMLQNGYQKSWEIFNKNSRLREVRVYIGDSHYRDIELFDEMGWQYIEFGTQVYTDHFTLEILSVYPGDKYTDTCITELYPLTLPEF